MTSNGLPTTLIEIARERGGGVRRSRWILPDAWQEADASLGSHYSPLLARALWARHLRTPADCQTWLRVERTRWQPWRAIPGLDRAVERIAQAVTSGEPIAVFGDYDADGMTATAILVLTLQALGAEVLWRLPDRLREGYGLNRAAVGELAACLRQRQPQGRLLLVTVDCGTSNGHEISEAASLDMDVVVVDHHVVSHEVPPALVLVNPRQPDLPYPDRDLTAAGLALHLAIGLLETCSMAVPEPDVECLKRELMGLAALGTLADVAPMSGQNRVLVSYGLRALRGRQRPGLAALMRVARIEPGQLDSAAVVWRLAPRLNSAGRMAHAELGLRLLLTEDQHEAAALSSRLEELNRQRQVEVERILDEAHDQLLQSTGLIPVLAHDGWSPGLAGLVAGKLAEEIGRPVIVLAYVGEEARGSARSIEGFNIIEALEACRPLLHRVGGHRQAAGLTLGRGQVVNLERALTALAERRWPAGPPEPVLRLDGAARFHELEYEVALELQRLEPFGAGNQEPVWLVEAGRTCEARRVGLDGKHLQFKLAGAQGSRRCIAFGQGDRLDELRAAGRVDVACCVRPDEWQGARRVQLEVKDFRPAQGQG